MCTYMNSVLLQTALNAYTVEMIESSPRSMIGESPYWSEETQSLYYCDIYGTECTVLRYCPADKKVYCATVDGYPIITFIAPVAGTHDNFVVGCNKSIEVIQWDGKSSKAKWVRTVLVVEKCPEFETNAFDDGKADPYCRLYAGTRRVLNCDDLDTVPTYGNFFRVSKRESPVTLSKPRTVRLSNGLIWNRKLNKFYYIDSCYWNIREYDYCPTTGDICEYQSVFIEKYPDVFYSLMNRERARSLQFH